MIIAHLPAGYLLTNAMQSRLKEKSLLWAGLLGSVFPDFDILYFYLIDDRQTSHRQYWTHVPFFWICVACLTLPFVVRFGGVKMKRAALFFYANLAAHLCFDTIVAPVYWLRPSNDQSVQFFHIHIEKVFDYWFWNYMFHPFFMVELLICAGAGILWVRNSYICNRVPKAAGGKVFENDTGYWWIRGFWKTHM